MLGHKTGGYRTTEIYAKFAPDYLGQEVKAIDQYFAEMTARLTLKGLEHTEVLRASSVLAVAGSDIPKRRNPQVSLGVSMVEPRGIEPLTSTMPL